MGGACHPGEIVAAFYSVRMINSSLSGTFFFSPCPSAGSPPGPLFGLISMDDIKSSALPSNLFDGLWKGEAWWRVASPRLARAEICRLLSVETAGSHQRSLVGEPFFFFGSEVFRKPPTLNDLQGNPAALALRAREKRFCCCFHQPRRLPL